MHDRPFRAGNFSHEDGTLGLQGKVRVAVAQWAPRAWNPSGSTADRALAVIASATPPAQSLDFFRTMEDDRES
jgi:hypothetical protein